MNNDDLDGVIAPVDLTPYDHTTTGYFTPEVFYSAVEKVLTHQVRVQGNPLVAEMPIDRELLRKTSASDEHRRALLLERNRRGHLCNDTCLCPVDGCPLLYHGSTDEHACVRPDCIFAHGMKGKSWMPVISRQGVRARYQKALAEARASQPLGRHPDVAEQHMYIAAFRAVGLTLAAPLDDLGHVVRIDREQECSCVNWRELKWERIGLDGIRRALAEGDEINPYCTVHGE